MTPGTPQLELEWEKMKITAAHEQGRLATLGTYFRLSGPGWLQSALTLGGGSLGSSLYLGILAGTSMLWLQPFAMMLGVIMLGAISYVSLSIHERPFRAINRHINPVLGWAWLGASLLANMVWSIPQYSLCFAVCEQNFFPSLFQGDGLLAGDLGKWAVSVGIFAFCTLITWSYGSGSVGVKLYEVALKLAVAVIVACFIGVVVRMSLVEGGVDWQAVWSGLVPKLEHFSQPTESFIPLLENISDPTARSYWTNLIVSQQRDVMISAGAAAVGINMTFLMPYALLARGWDKTFRGLAVFDVCTGTFFPFVLATSCIVIASAQQFHTKLPDGFSISGDSVAIPERFEDQFGEMIEASRDPENPHSLTGAPTAAEQRIAAVLVKRDTFDLAHSLARLFAGPEGSGGKLMANLVFGGGVVAMTISSISLMMLISGFVVCEVANRPPEGWLFRGGCLLSATGVLWPLLWSGGAKAWLTVVAGVFGAMLLPIAYVTFFMMFNQRSLMGIELPSGWRRWVWNVLMALAAVCATIAGVSAVIKTAGYLGLGFVAAFLAVVATVQWFRRQPPENKAPESWHSV